MKRIPIAAVLVVLTGCNSLPREIRREIADAGAKLRQSEKQFQRESDEIRDDLSHAPDLFNAAPAAGEWRSRLSAAKGRLDAAESDQRQLETLDKSGHKEDAPRVRQLLSDEDRLRKSSLDEADSIDAQATHWLDFQHNLPHYLAKMRDAHDAVGAADFAAVTKTVEKAERDWPGKRADLESRLQTLKTAPDRAERQWQATEAERQAAADAKATGPQIATLIQADEVIEAAARLPEEATELTARCGQLYNAWDRILDDLDIENGRYREKIKTVRTRFAEAGDRSPQTSTDERWVDASPAEYHAVENDLGMAVAHKDAGLYDSEAQTTAQPAGFAYIAPPSVGSNQYGYWTHTDHGSFWTFLPQYLIMRELFWGHDYYRPIVVNEYNSYYNAYRSGHTWYGQESPAAPPKYGSQGTFTQQHYSSSRYVQSGGFKNSGFASHVSPAQQPPPSGPRAAPPSSPSSQDGISQGKRFGRPAGPGAPSPAGKHFGGKASPPAGRRFGGGHRR
jgi:hypothetical protein